MPKPYCSNVSSFKINATCFDIFSRMQWHSYIFKCDWGVHILYFLRERRIWVKVVWCCIIHERCCFRRTALGLSEEISSSQVFVSQRWSFERRYWAKMKRRSVTHTNDTPLSHTQTQCLSAARGSEVYTHRITTRWAGWDWGQRTQKSCLTALWWCSLTLNVFMKFLYSADAMIHLSAAMDLHDISIN